MTTLIRPRNEFTIRLKRPHGRQQPFVESTTKRIVVRAGRRGGKTTGIAIRAVQRFLQGRRILYATPTADQITRFWYEIKLALAEPIDAGVLYKNESLHIIETPGTENRIRAKTAWNADTLRGDFADDLFLDEWQLMSEDAWELVGAPMLLDRNGDAVFIYTPPSLSSRSVTKARDPRHASKMFKRAQEDATGRWETHHFASADNPHISTDALDEITQDMTSLAYRQEILAEDIDEVPGALWTFALLEQQRVSRTPELARIVVALDPAVTSTEQSDETGIIAAGTGECACKGQPETHGFVLRDGSGRYSPDGWADKALSLYDDAEADRIVAEDNNGGEMVEYTIKTKRRHAPVKRVRASRGKDARAEPVAALYEQGMVHHVGELSELEDQLCSWVAHGGSRSPDRLDALVWAITELMLDTKGRPRADRFL